MSAEQIPAPADHAVEKFKQGFACSQAVFSVLARDRGISEETALRIAAPFGGGLAHMGNVCGAVSGGLMALVALHRHA